MPPKLGLLAGGGNLPSQLIATCAERGRDLFVVAFEGCADPETVSRVPHCWVRLGAIGKIIRELRRAGVEEVVLAGGIGRPSWRSVKPDLRGMKMLPRVLAAGQGDGSILSVAIAELESEGFRVIGIEDVVVDLLAPEGVLGRVRPDPTAEADIARAVEVARAVGAADVGQAVVVQQGIVLGVEAVEGTDALLGRCAGLRRDGAGGVLLKLKKPGQDRRADLPTIGATTVDNALAAGLRGIAVEAGATLVVDRGALVAKADERQFFVVGVRIAR
ncbi:MAG: UDP-2,3-diacylglucosamine diphosphatase LpxI [Alphaproteobacteria bacterium]|nr:UDP-2,3-diacylglucosamine diphosphatase LpxI [Alphaproteobacteria bacterium]